MVLKTRSTARRGGAVAGGNPLTVQAGLDVLRAGGTAVDAAIAAQLMACVCEPLLTGLCGGGLAMVRTGGTTRVCDFFSDVPGRGGSTQASAMRAIDVDFGPDVQRFWIGAASVAVPALAEGVWALHAAHATMPLSELAAPAVEAARAGVPATVGLCRSINLLTPIMRCDPLLTALFLRDDAPIAPGTLFAQPAFAETLAQLGREGPAFLRAGEGAADILDACEGGYLTHADLAEYRAAWRKPLSVTHRGATVWVPGPPSQAGLQVIASLSALDPNAPADPYGSAALDRFSRAMAANEALKGADFQARLFEEGFTSDWLARCVAGNTTHVSVVDGAGDAVGITSSLGETAGIVAPRTGLILNNFLGEEDVNPPHAPRPVGARLLTMCCPTLLERVNDAGDADMWVMGSGGSSRIRSALLHGVVYTIDHDLPLDAVVAAPRAHLEDDTLRYETIGRGPDLQVEHPNAIAFETQGLFFGGLHIAGTARGKFVGAGDARRSGEAGTVVSIP
ncbi:MAG: gamma-glutamyltranspeptidase/glutathione hydrolase [Bradymonadia bacterium]